MVTQNLDSVFNPKSVAIIGASDEEGSVGHAIVKNFIQHGYAGKVYLVNIRKPEILGVKTYQNIAQIPETVDLAMIATPAKTVPGVVEECGKAGVKGFEQNLHTFGGLGDDQGDGPKPDRHPRDEDDDRDHLQNDGGTSDAE